MTSWDHFNPGAGDSTAVRDFANEQQRRANDLETTIDGVVTVQSGVTDKSAARAIDAWAERVDEFEADYRTAINWLEDRKRAAETYANAVEDIAARAKVVRSQIRTLTSTRHHLPNQDIPEAALNYRLQQIDDSLAKKSRLLSALGDEREAADSVFTSTLNVRLDVDGLATWATLKNLYGQDALTGNYFDFLDRRREIVDEATRLLEELADGRLDDEDLARLEEIMRGLAKDRGGSNQLWKEVDGEQTREMLWALSLDIPSEEGSTSPSLDVAQFIRESLSLGSADWDQAHADKFVRDMTTGDRFPAESLPGQDVISFLFADVDGAPMGATFAEAMATRLDEHARQPDPMVFGGANTSLTLQASFGKEGTLGSVPGAHQPMGLVLETLGQYPEPSLEWLTDSNSDAFSSGSTAGEERIKYWLGEHDWGDEGMTGVTAAIEGAMNAEGGIAGGTVDMDSQVWEKQAELLYGTINSLGDGTGASFTPDNLSPSAQESLAKTLNTSLPWIVETSVAGSPHAQPGNATEVQFLAAGETLPAPLLRDTALTKVWGAVASTEHGLPILTAGVHDYQARAITMAEYGEVTGVKWGNALDRVYALEGFHQGASGGVQQYLAKVSDDNAKAVIDGLGTVTGLVPVPGAEKLPHAVQALFTSDATRDFVVDVGKTVAIDATSDAAVSRWGDSLSAVMSQTNDDLLTGYVALSERYDELVAGNPPGLIEQLDGHETVSTFKSARMETFTDNYKAALVDVNQTGLNTQFEDKLAKYLR